MASLGVSCENSLIWHQKNPWKSGFRLSSGCTFFFGYGLVLFYQMVGRLQDRGRYGGFLRQLEMWFELDGIEIQES